MPRRVQVIQAEIEAEVPYNAADPAQVHEARVKSGRRTAEKLNFTQEIMSKREGRKWIWDLFQVCHTFDNPLVPGDTHQTYFQLGEQNIGKRLLQDVQQFEDLYVAMCRENRSS